MTYKEMTWKEIICKMEEKFKPLDWEKFSEIEIVAWVKTVFED